MNGYVDFLVKLVATLVAALTVVYQLGRQHRSSLALQKENLKDKERVKFFDYIAEKIARAQDSIVEVSHWGSLIPSALHLHRTQAAIQGFRPAPIKYRSTELLELQQAAGLAVGDVIRIIEYREVIAPGFIVFRYAIARQSERCQKAFQEFYEASLVLLPVEPPSHLAAHGVMPRALREPTAVDITNLEVLGKAMEAEFLTLSNYLNDLSREAQNQLLGSIFDQEVHLRMPLDPDVLVISSRKEDLPKIESRLKLQEVLHPDSLPSRILNSKRQRPSHRSLRFWRTEGRRRARK